MTEATPNPVADVRVAVGAVHAARAAWAASVARDELATWSVYQAAVVRMHGASRNLHRYMTRLVGSGT